MLVECRTRSVHRYLVDCCTLFTVSCVPTVEDDNSIPKLTYEVIAHRPYVGTRENVKSGLSSLDMLSLIHLVHYRRGQHLLLRGGGWGICRPLFKLYITKVDGYCWAAEQGKEFYMTIM